MNQFIICYTKADKSAFISNSIGVNDLSAFRVKNTTYYEELDKLLAHCDIGIIYINDVFPDTQVLLFKLLKVIRENNLENIDKLRICALNLQYYPFNFNDFILNIKNGFLTELPFIIYREDNIQRPIAFFCEKHEIIKHSFPSEPVYNYLEKNSLADLASHADAIQLFNRQLVSRDFNHIRESSPGYFRKRSNRLEKMRAEYDYLTNLPAPIRPFYPQCGDFYQNDSYAEYDIEIVPNIDAAKLLINNYFSSRLICNRFMDSILVYLSAVPGKNISVDAYREKMIDIFVDKTKKRLNDLLKLPDLKQLNKISDYQINLSIEEFANRYIIALENDIYTINETELWYSHGDLFFGNILYDPTTTRLKLIDPRGGHGDTCFLPKWYDLAKLSHSFFGLYDLMIYGLIEARLDHNMKFELKFNRSLQGIEDLQNAFLNFLNSRKIDIKRLRLYEGSLFLSMLPLHQECPIRMTMQLLRAIEIFKNFGPCDF